MTNINCSANCIYQKDGKCSYESISPKTIHFSQDCVYFQSFASEEQNKFEE